MEKKKEKKSIYLTWAEVIVNQPKGSNSYFVLTVSFDNVHKIRSKWVSTHTRKKTVGIKSKIGH